MPWGWKGRFFFVMDRIRLPAGQVNRVNTRPTTLIKYYNCELFSPFSLYNPRGWKVKQKRRGFKTSALDPNLTFRVITLMAFWHTVVVHSRWKNNKKGKTETDPLADVWWWHPNDFEDGAHICNHCALVIYFFFRSLVCVRESLHVEFLWMSFDSLESVAMSPEGGSKRKTRWSKFLFCLLMFRRYYMKRGNCWMPRLGSVKDVRRRRRRRRRLNRHWGYRGRRTFRSEGSWRSQSQNPLGGLEEKSWNLFAQFFDETL